MSGLLRAVIGSISDGNGEEWEGGVGVCFDIMIRMMVDDDERVWPDHSQNLIAHSVNGSRNEERETVCLWCI